MHRARLLARVLLIVTVVSLAVVIAFGIAGYVVFTRAKVDTLEPADAVVVLAGEHDGREEYGRQLAQQGWAPTVVLSDPYPEDDRIMKRACRSEERIEVICLDPYPNTTRGEAVLMRRLGQQRGWSKVIVVSWRFHLPRARLVFQQCFSAQTAVLMQAVPPRHNLSITRWGVVYAYQYAAFVKALVQGDCP